MQVNTHNETNTHSVGLPWTSDQHVAEDCTYVTHNTHKRQISITSAGFKPAIPASERPQANALDLSTAGVGCVLFYVVKKQQNKTKITSRQREVSVGVNRVLYRVIILTISIHPSLCSASTRCSLLKFAASRVPRPSIHRIAVNVRFLLCWKFLPFGSPVPRQI